MALDPKETLDTMLGYLGFVCEIEEIDSASGKLLQVHTSEARQLIGHDGRTLSDVQYLLNRLLQANDKEAPRVHVDIEHYKGMKEDTLVARARQLAESVKATGNPIQLDPMNSYHRRIIHNAFLDDPDIMTSSPSDDARIKRITLRRRPRKEKADQDVG